MPRSSPSDGPLNLGSRPTARGHRPPTPATRLTIAILIPTFFFFFLVAAASVSPGRFVILSLDLEAFGATLFADVPLFVP